MGLVYSVQNICEITGLSKRTLHYYDETKLLVPEKKDNGYRSYTQKDLEKLQKILFFKNVGLSLNEIKEVICLSDALQRNYLKKQQSILKRKQQTLADTIKTLNAFLSGKNLLEIESYQSNVQPLNQQYQKEAEIRYGETQSYQTYKNRRNQLNKKERQRLDEKINASMTKIFHNIAKAQQQGYTINDMVVQTEIECLYDCLNRLMECSTELFQCIARQYVEDQRFHHYFDQFQGENLPVFIYDSVYCFCVNKAKLEKRNS